MPVSPAPRKVRSPDEPLLRRKEDLINFWAERITQKITPDGTHRLPHYDRNSIRMSGDSIYSGSEIARIVRHSGGTARIVLCNGDRWSNGRGWGNSAMDDQMTAQRYVRQAIEGTDIRMLIVPFSTLDAANIELESVEPLHIRADRMEHERHVYTERPGPFQKMADPNGATYPHSEQAWGYLNDAGEVWERDHFTPGAAYSPPEGYTWGSYTKVTEKTLMVDNPNVAHTKSYGRGDNRHWYGEAERQDDGTWVWTESHHRLGDSLFRARYVERGERKATKAERDQHIAHAKAHAIWHRANEAWGELSREHSNLRWLAARYERGADLFDQPCPTEDQITEVEAHAEDAYRTMRELESQVPDEGPAERRGDAYVVPFTRRRWAKFLSSYDFNEPHSPYFMCQLPPTKATTIEDALDALMPGDVRSAIELGLDVIRQGDVFAIPTAYTTKELELRAVRDTVTDHVLDYAGRLQRMELQVPIRKLRGKGDATILDTNHSATHVIRTSDGNYYGRGSIYHTPEGWGRRPEHRVQKLGDGKTWYRFVKNTVPLASTTNWRRQTMGNSTFQSGQSRAWMLGGAVD